MNPIWKYLAVVFVYICIFIPPALQEPESNARFEAVFAAVFIMIFFLIIFCGSFLLKKILSLLGIQVLSTGGDIIKTDVGSNFENAFVRNFVNITADTFFNLIFVLFLIFFAVGSASIADNAASTI